MPTINSIYPTNSHCAIIGSSLGGLFSLYVLDQYPSQISGIAALSPSLWADEHSVLHSALEKASPDHGKKIAVIAGGEESLLMRKNASKLYHALYRNGWNVFKEFPEGIHESGRHHEKSWGSQMERILPFLFPP